MPPPTVHDFLHQNLNILVTGPSFPHRDAPVQVYTPILRSFPREERISTILHQPGESHRLPQRPLAISGAPRSIPSSAAKDGQAVVYDKNVVNMWRMGHVSHMYEVFFWEKALEAAIGQEVLHVAVEDWLGRQHVESLTPVEILQSFGSYIDGLGTQPVSIPLRDLVIEMVESFQVVNDLSHCSWTGPCHDTSALISVLEEFVRSQEVYFFPENREPVLEIAFSVRKWRVDGLDVELFVSWNPVLVGFESLNNVVVEGRDFRVKPFFSEPCNLPPEENHQVAVPTTSSFSDDIRGCLVGQAPEILAGLCGAQRTESYTIALEFEGKLFKHFPEGTKLEKDVRVALPLTIRRAPDKCGWDAEIPLSPRVDDGTLSRRSGLGTAQLGRRLGMMRSGRATFGTVQSTSVPASRKENQNVTAEELCKLLERKAETNSERSPTSPTHLNDPLSLARFYDALSLHRPPAELRNVEVRALRETQRMAPLPANNNSPYATPRRDAVVAPKRSPFEQPSKSSPEEVVFGPPADLLQVTSPPDPQSSTDHGDVISPQRLPFRQPRNPSPMETPHQVASSIIQADFVPGSRQSRIGQTPLKVRRRCGAARPDPASREKADVEPESLSPKCEGVHRRDSMDDIITPPLGKGKAIAKGESRGRFPALDNATRKERVDDDVDVWPKGRDRIAHRRDLLDDTTTPPLVKGKAIAAREPLGVLSPAQRNERDATASRRDVWFHGPVRDEEVGNDLEEQMRAIEDRFSKQQKAFTEQVRWAKRSDRAIDLHAIFSNPDRVDEKDVKDLGPKDAQARLCDCAGDNDAEHLEQVEGSELARLTARVNEKVVVDIEAWQSAIQANHRELNGGNGEKEAVWGPVVKLDTTMVDVADSDETELEGFSE